MKINFYRVTFAVLAVYFLIASYAGCRMHSYESVGNFLMVLYCLYFAYNAE